MRTVCSVLLAVTILILFGCEKPESPAENTYRKAEEMKVSERYSDALRLYKKAVEIDPEYERAYLDIAWIYDDQLEDREQAAEWYQRYIDVSSNPEMKEKAISWRDEARIAVDDVKTGTGDLADLSPKTKALIDKQVALEKSQLEQEYSAKERALTLKYEADSDKINADLKSLRLENRELKDTVETLQIDNEALQKRVASAKSSADLAALLDSPEFSGSDKQAFQQLARMKISYDQLNVQYKQVLSKYKQMEKDYTKTRQQLAASRRIERADDKTIALQNQVKSLQEDNTRLSERVRLLEGSVSVDVSADTAAKDDEIKRLQNRIAGLETDLNKALADKHEAEQTLAELSERTEAILADADKGLDKDTLDKENRNLRLQIAGIRTEYNKMSEKYAVSEQRVGELERELEKRPKVDRDTSPGTFTDLSDEIKDMQTVIVRQNRKITTLEKANRELQQQLQTAPKDETTIALARAEQDNRELKDALLQAQTQKASYASLEERNTQLQEQIRVLTSERDEKDQLAQQYADQLNEHKEKETSRTRELELEIQGLRQRLQAYADVSVSRQPYRPVSRTTRPSTSTGSETVRVDDGWKPLEEKRDLPGSTPTTRYPRTTTRQPRTTPRTTYTRSPYTPRTTSRTARARTYVVRGGDTLSGISRKFYGTPDRWREIYQANRDILKGGNALRVGQRLVIP
jgi:nucleoid-associated protein YgaU